MVLLGKIWKDENSEYWIAEVSALDISTQGESKEEALSMIQDAIESFESMGVRSEWRDEA